LAAAAPELDLTIDAALSELDQSETEAKLHNDPLRLPWMALASFLRAQKQLHAGMVDSSSPPRRQSVGRSGLACWAIESGAAQRYRAICWPKSMRWNCRGLKATLSEAVAYGELGFVSALPATGQAAQEIAALMAELRALEWLPQPAYEVYYVWCRDVLQCLERWKL
jgi:hypothetical protein